MYVVSPALHFYVNGYITKGVQCFLPFPWYEGNQPTIWQIAIFETELQRQNRTVNYPNISSAIRPVPHTKHIPVPVPPQQYILDSDDEPTENWGKTPQPSTSMDADFHFNKFHQIMQEELNDLITDLDLAKSKAEL